MELWGSIGMGVTTSRVFVGRGRSMPDGSPAVLKPQSLRRDEVEKLWGRLMASFRAFNALR